MEYHSKCGKVHCLLYDNIEFMKGCDNLEYDLAIPDPPYGINAPNMQMGSNPKRSRTDGHGSGPGISTTQRLNTGSLILQ